MKSPASHLLNPDRNRFNLCADPYLGIKLNLDLLWFNLTKTLAHHRKSHTLPFWSKLLRYPPTPWPFITFINVEVSSLLPAGHRERSRCVSKTEIGMNTHNWIFSAKNAQTLHF